MQHLIKKQVIELNLLKEADAFKMQQAVSGHYRQNILPLLEQVFDELSNEEEIIRIDRMDIDLGWFSEEDIFKNTWDRTLILKIKEQLHEKVATKLKDKTTSREAKALNACRQWLFYMQKGYLPWNSLETNETWYKQVLEALAVDFGAVSELRKLVAAKPDVIRRIVLQHDELFLTKLVAILTAENQSDLPEAVSELQELFLYKKGIFHIDKDEKEIKVNIWEQVLRLATNTAKQLTAERLVEKILIWYLPDATLINQFLTNIPLKTKIILPVIKRLEEKPEIFLERKQSIRKALLKLQEEWQKNSVLKESIESKPEKNIDESGIFVQDAGLVLVHLFLLSLFKKIEWLKGKEFKNNGIKQKALYLLYYLANGNMVAEEHALMVPKILCGWPIDIPVEKEIKLTGDEQNEADNMLQAVVEHWAVLKKTSIAGLREGFLQRNGKLFTKNNKLYLQVENKPIDILLDHLPWNLNIIKLPWMKEILRVEWR